MTKIYLVICKNKFYLYDEARKPVRIAGKNFFEYDRNKIREATSRLTKELVNMNKLSSESELKFFVVENSDAALNEGFAKVHGDLVAKKFSLEGLMRTTIRELSADPKLYVDEFGINYDGDCYRRDNERLTRSNFSLLALSIEPEALLKFFD